MISHVTQFFNFTNEKFLTTAIPQDDELLSSWLVRTAYENLTKPTSFTNLHFKDIYAKNLIWQRDLDLWADNEFIELLSKKSLMSKEYLNSMTLKSYESYLNESITHKTSNSFILPLGNYAHIKKSYGLRFCPICLKEDKDAYFRKSWRLSFYTACTKHKIFLHNSCPSCNAPLTISKMYKDIEDKKFTYCYKCGFNLRESPIEKIPQDSYGLYAIEKLMSILKDGYFKFGDRVYYSIFYFMVLNQIRKMVYLWERNKSVYEHEILSKEIELHRVERNQKPQFESYLSPKELYLVYSATVNILESKSHLNKYFKLNRITKSLAFKDMKYVPFWYKISKNVSFN